MHFYFEVSMTKMSLRPIEGEQTDGQTETDGPKIKNKFTNIWCFNFNNETFRGYSYKNKQSMLIIRMILTFSLYMFIPSLKLKPFFFFEKTIGRFYPGKECD